jgi:hypothetical protein
MPVCYVPEGCSPCLILGTLFEGNSPVRFAFILCPGLMASLLGVVRADEGMFLFNNPPRDLLKRKYNFDLTDAWLERTQKASIRFNNGGSGSFVSPNGLIITNHHIGASSLQKVSTRDKDYFRDGFYARTRAEELKCPALELNVLQSITDATGRVQAAVKKDMTPAQAAAARRAVLAQIEKEALDRTKLRSDVVTLYHGAKYHLYQYKKYTDVRLVFAPEHGIAFFGGDTDNFEYPRFNLDICLFRAYENGKPVKVKHYLKWSPKGPAAGDLVFVSGHPGTTNRLETLAKLRQRRDYALPYLLSRVRAMEALLVQYGERGPEEARQAQKYLARVANARKAYAGMYQGLLDPAILARKAEEELALRKSFQADRDRDRKSSDPWQGVAKAQKALAGFHKEYALLELGDAFDTELFRNARHLVRLAAEIRKPSEKRLREYRDSNLESLKFQLFSRSPLDLHLAQMKLAGSLTFLAEKLGGEHPLVVKVLAGKSPAARAEELIKGTKLADPAERKRLAKGDQKTLEQSRDPLIVLARLIDSDARRLRARYESEVEEPERQAYSLIGRARFRLKGTAVPPDATFTLRLAFGVVKGYRVDGKDLLYATTFGGAFERADKGGHREPFELPRRWRDNKTKLDLKTPFNFVSTADTIGGNSGSPVLNRAGEFVGINFDRNRHGLVRNFVYTDEQARHISVHSRGILEALRRLYDAGPLVEELLGTQEKQRP